MLVVTGTVRRLRHSWLSLVAVVLPLGILSGGTTAIAYGTSVLWFHPLPYHDADQIVQLEPGLVRGAEFVALSSLSTLEAFAGARPLPLLPWSRLDGTATALKGVAVTEAFFSVFAVSPAIGRLPPPEERGGAVLVSWRLWTRELASDPSPIGMRFIVDGKDYTLAGVMPDGFNAPRMFEPAWPEPDVWLFDQVGSQTRSVRGLVGRLRSRATAEAAEEEIRGILAAEAARSGSRVRRPSVVAGVSTVRATVVGFVVPILTFSLILWVMGVANAVPVLVAQVSSSADELTLVKLLGARRRDVAARLAAPQVVAALGAALVAALSVGPAEALLRLSMPAEWAIVEGVALGWPAVGTAAIVAAAGVAIANVPAMVALRSASLLQARNPLRHSPRRSVIRRSGPLTLQVVLAVVLLTIGGVFARTLLHVRTADRGVDPNGLMIATVWNTQDMSVESLLLLAERWRSRPDVKDVSWSLGVPGLTPTSFASVALVGAGREVGFGIEAVSGAYFAVVGLSVVAGRPFSDDSLDEVVIDEEGSRLMGWSPLEALGKPAPWSPTTGTVVGVVENVRLVDGLEREQGTAYVPLAHRLGRSARMLFRDGGGTSGIEELQADANVIVPGTLVVGLGPLTGPLLSRYQIQDFLFLSALTAGVVAAGIFIVGVAGLLVGEIRTRADELAVRCALGATRSDLRRVLARDALVASIVGVLVAVPVTALAVGAVKQFVIGPSGIVMPYIIVSLGAVASVVAIASLAVRFFRVASLVVQVRN